MKIISCYKQEKQKNLGRRYAPVFQAVPTTLSKIDITNTCDSVKNEMTF